MCVCCCFLRFGSPVIGLVRPDVTIGGISGMASAQLHREREQRASGRHYTLFITKLAVPFTLHIYPPAKQFIQTCVFVIASRRHPQFIRYLKHIKYNKDTQDNH